MRALRERDDVRVDAEARVDAVARALDQRVGVLFVLPDDAVARAERVDHLARHGVQHLLQHEARGDAVTGVEQRVDPGLLLVLLATGPQAVDRQSGEIAGVARERQTGSVQAAGRPHEHEAAVRRLAGAERHQDISVAADGSHLS